MGSATDKRAKKLVADILSRPGGVEELYKQCPPNERAPSAYAFLAMACKDHSALGTAATLLREVVRIERSDQRAVGSNIHNHVLNLAHVLETNHDYPGALRAMGEHLKLVADGAIASNGVVPASEYATVVSAYLDGDSLPATWTGGDRSAAGKRVAMWYPPTLDTSLRIVWHPTSADSGANEGYATVVSSSERDADDEMVGPPLDLSTDLDLLAIAFTIVKILFVQGCLSTIPPLVRAIEAIRRRAKESLHSTNVRNEQAYYMCICQVMAAMQDPHSPLRHSPFNVQCEDAKPLYVVGDSHSLSCAWSIIDIAGEKRIVVPKLVTGVKQWHLRAKSDFYTKESFNKTIASIPNGSDVSVPKNLKVSAYCIFFTNSLFLVCASGRVPNWRNRLSRRSSGCCREGCLQVY